MPILRGKRLNVLLEMIRFESSELEISEHR